MSQSLYKFFYRQYGVRKVTQILNPQPLKILGLPRNSLFHYYNESEDKVAIDTDISFLSMSKVKCLVDFTTQYTENTRGNFRKKPFLVRSVTREFFKTNKNYRYLPEAFKNINNERILFIHNHSYLNTIYKYPEMPMTDYYRWYNTYSTILNNINYIANNVNKNQFLYINIPEDVPTYPIFELYMNRESVQLLKLFDTSSKYVILELWKWLDEEYRANSIFNIIDKAKYNDLNLIFKYKDVEVLINLGYLNSFIKGQANSTELTSLAQFPNMFIKKLMLRLFINIKNIAAINDIKQTEQTIDIAEDSTEIEFPDDEDLDNDYDESDSSNRLKHLIKLSDDKTEEKQVPVVYDETIINNQDTELDIETQLKTIDDELKSYDKFYKLKLEKKGLMLDKKGNVETIDFTDTKEEIPLEELKDKVFTAKSPDQVLLHSIEDLAKMDSITVSEYKKFKKAINDYDQSTSVYDSSKKTKDLIGYSDNDVKLENNNKITKISDVVMDKNMANMSVKSLDKDYLDKLYHKDITNVIYNLQKTNVVIKSHTVDIENSALGNYEYHRLELMPIDGAPSTVVFKIPVINGDGSFEAGSVKYMMRKQRVDLPLRKISPTKVSLVSYYGKNFVELSRMKSNNSIEYIVKQIYKQYQDKKITKLAPGDVYDNYFKSPYIYSALSNRFKSLEKDTFKLIFDKEQLKTDIGEDRLSKLKLKDHIACGLDTIDNSIIVIDNNNEFYKVTNNNLSSLGDIYDLLDINKAKAPIDFAEFRVFDKYIPVGIILGYLIGFNNLLRLLDVKYQKIENKEDITSNLLVIKFMDGLYGFDKRNTTAIKIIAGLLEHEKTLKTINLADLNNKDTYFILFEEKNITSVYINEIELTNELFIDPITESILKSMNEPTTFAGLLIRATELLDEYTYPDSQDFTQMRIRGYERIAGFIYKELSRSIKTFKNKNINGRSKIDLGPYDVWNSILKDNSIKLIEDINPIQDLKERDIVTYVGEGGRNKDAIQKEARSFHRSDYGVISEATVDSADVAVNAYLTANPNVSNLRGLVDMTEDGNTVSVLSTSANLAPFSVMDD